MSREMRADRFKPEGQEMMLTRTIVVPLLVLLALLFAACARTAESPAKSGDDAAIRGLVVARAYAVSAATSALESIDRGEIDVARSTLEAEVTSGLTQLYVLAGEARPEDAQMIAEAIREAEEYVEKKNLKVQRPDSRLQQQ